MIEIKITEFKEINGDKGYETADIIIGNFNGIEINIDSTKLHYKDIDRLFNISKMLTKIVWDNAVTDKGSDILIQSALAFIATWLQLNNYEIEEIYKDKEERIFIKIK